MPHNVWQTTREDNLRQFNRTLKLLRTYLPGTMVIPAMGNHEGVPVNSFPIPQIKGESTIYRPHRGPNRDRSLHSHPLRKPTLCLISKSADVLFHIPTAPYGQNRRFVTI